LYLAWKLAKQRGVVVAVKRSMLIHHRVEFDFERPAEKLQRASFRDPDSPEAITGYRTTAGSPASN